MKHLENIRAIRKEKGITQLEMSEKLGMAKNNYGKVENGQTEMAVSRLYQIADILGVNIIKLLGENVGDAQKIAELEKINEEIGKKNKDLQADLDRTKEMFDAVWPFAKTVLDIFKKSGLSDNQVEPLSLSESQKQNIQSIIDSDFPKTT